nr:MAG TPA: hypothetical protein [Crassvirales sp.]
MSIMKKRKANKYKEFAVGTRIKYNGKLYEVTESVNCADCSIANICSNSNIDDKTGYGLSVDKRLNIFGECSSFDRHDSKSVVFVEISTDNTKDKYYKIEPLFRDDNSIQLRPVEFDLPNGYVIDKEHSDLDKGIIRFKNKWLSLEQMYNIAKATNYHTYLSEIKDYRGDKTCEVREKLIALANLMDIARYFNGDWEYDITKEVVGYSIAYYKFVEKPHYSVCKLDNSVYTYYGSPVFKNKADAQYVIDNPNFKDVLDMIFKV